MSVKKETECLMGLKLADEPNVLQHDNGWVDVTCQFGLDPRLVDWIYQHDMTPTGFVFDFLSDAIDVFCAYFAIESDEDNNVKEC